MSIYHSHVSSIAKCRLRIILYTTKDSKMDDLNEWSLMLPKTIYDTILLLCHLSDELSRN